MTKGFQAGHTTNIRHGHSVDGPSPEYRCWTDIKTRCLKSTSKMFKYYGGRGITICDRWKDSFENFLADVGMRPSPHHTIDRYPNNDGNYEPGNVRWATRQEQIDNRRNTRKIMKRYSIVGQKFRGLDPYLAGTPAGIEAVLAREPTNKFDPNAVAVFIEDVHVGYLPAKENGPVADLIDKTGETRMLPTPGGSANAKADDADLVPTKSLVVKFVRSPNSGYPQVEL